MKWLNKVVDEVVKAHPDGDVMVESGISPSGSYHMGYLREILTCDAVALELKRRGREARHVHFVDDQDGFRKVPASLPEEYESYLGKPLCDIPAPDDSGLSYADYCLQPFLLSVQTLGVKMEVVRSHQKYREGFFTTAIELVLSNLDQIKKVLEEISGRKLSEDWSPIQVNEAGYLKKRPFLKLNQDIKTISYLDKDSQPQSISYERGQVKLDWRIDWPARWWLLGVEVEPFGHDHATKGGSYDTGKGLMKNIFKTPAPLPIPYNFINRAGDSKKMSASSGNGIDMSEVIRVLPAEVVRYFIFRFPADKLLFFDPEGVAKLIDDFSELLAKPNKNEADLQLIELCTNGVNSIVSRVPFSHLVSSYQASLRDSHRTLEIIARTEYKNIVDRQKETILKELKFIDTWLDEWAPEDMKFTLLAEFDDSGLSLDEKNYLRALADKIAHAPLEADGEWFHKAIYEFKDQATLEPKQLFQVLYRATIGKNSGPRAGWFLSMLPRQWLVDRLNLQK